MTLPYFREMVISGRTVPQTVCRFFFVRSDVTNMRLPSLRFHILCNLRAAALLTLPSLHQ